MTIADPLDTVRAIGVGTLVAISALCFLIVSIRNLVSTVQLLLAAFVFRTRIKPAARSYDLWTRYADLALPVSVIAPCYNEELSIVDSIRALLALEYPDHEVIVVNDGSSDATLATLIEHFEMHPIEREQLAELQQTRIKGIYGSARYANLLLIDKENGRKADAVNAGLAQPTADALKKAGAKLVLMAGRPGDNEAALKAAGVDQFLSAGADAVATLKGLQERLAASVR